MGQVSFEACQALGREMQLPKIDFKLINQQIEKYFWTICFLIAVFVVLRIFHMPLTFVLPLLVAFYWNWILSTNQIKKKAEQRKYAFSFLRFAYILHKVLAKIGDNTRIIPPFLIRSFSPLAFFLIIFIATGEVYFFQSILGSLLFELANRINQGMN